MSAPLRFEIGADRVGWIRFNDPERKVNVLSMQVMELLEGIVENLQEHNLAGLVLASDKPKVFLAGADIELIRSITNPAEGVALCRRGQKIFQAIADLKCPTVCMVDGPCLGVGLEIALACDWILASDSANTKLGLPEVMLGILPGLGGTQRLTRRVGLANALDLILTGKQLDGKRAEKMKIADFCCPVELLPQQVGRWLKKGKRAEKIPQAWMASTPLRNVICSIARKKALKQTRGHYPSPLEAIEAIRTGLASGIEKGLAFEAEAFGRLAVTGASKSLTRLFFLKERFAKRPEGVERRFNRAGVIGAGIMGGGIANLLASKKISVRIKDIAPAALAKALSTAFDLNKSLSKRGKEGKLEANRRMWRISPTLDYSGMRDVDIVIEAVVENLGLKQKVFAELEDHVGPNAILATNTCPPDRRRRQDAFPNAPWGSIFNPVHRMDLVEVIAGENLKRRRRRLRRDLEDPGRRRGRPWLLVNRILLPYVRIADGAPVESWTGR